MALYGDKTSNVIIVARALSTSHPISINRGPGNRHRSLLMRSSANLSRGHDNANSGRDSAGNCNQVFVRRWRFEVLISQ